MPRERWDETIVLPGDELIFTSVPAGIEIALAIGLTGLLATAVGTAITLGFAFGATFLAQKLLGAPDDADMGDSPTYSFGNIQNTTRNGQPIAVIYGEHKVGGEVINVFTTSDEQGNSSLRLLIGLGEGTIESIAGLTSDFNDLEGSAIPDGIKINGNEANLLAGVTVSGRLGSDGQSIIPGFRDLVNAVNVNLDLDFNTSSILSLRQLFNQAYTPNGQPASALHLNVSIANVTSQFPAASVTIDGDDEDSNPTSETLFFQDDGVRSTGGLFSSVSLITAAGFLSLRSDSTIEVGTPSGATYTTSMAVDAFEVVLFFPNGLYKIDSSDGDIDHESAFYRVRWRKSDELTFRDDTTVEVRRRTTSPFTVTYRNDNPFNDFGQSVIVTIEVTRLSGNDDERHKKEFIWQTVNEIDINGGLKYQHTALLGLEIVAQEAVNNTVPSVTVIVEGKQVFIWDGVDPDPETATYTLQYSSNPAWCAMDLILNKRYGGGDRFDACTIDLVSFKEWADYCDELIPDTIGGDMRRWELGLVLDEAEPFWDQILRICACGRATILKDGNIFRVKIERPSDPVQLFTSGNMKVGTLVIQYASNQDRANVVEVQYLDAANEYENSIAGREDETALEQVGDPVRKESVQLYGITKQARAYRAAQYLLNINSRWLTTVEFEAPVDAIAAEPGDVILVSHDIWSQLSGRIHTTSATSTQVVIDRDLTITAGQTWKITVRTSALGSDSLQERTIVSSPGTYLTGSVLTVNAPWTGGDLPQKYDLYGLGNTAIQPHVKLYRMVSSELRPDLTRHIAALEYDETVYDDDPGTIIEDPSDPPITPDTIPPNGTSLTLLEGGGPSINASWVKAGWPFAYQSQVYLRNETDGATTFVLVGQTFESTFVITDGVFLSNFYTVSIVPMAPNGQHGPPENGLLGTILISGNTGFPDPVTDLTCSQQGRNVTLQWTGVDPADNNLSHYEIRRGLEWIHGHQIGTTTAVMFTTTDWPVGLETFIVRTVSNAGKLDLNPDRHECLLLTPVPEVSVINRDEVALGWPGTKTNLTVDGDGSLRISDTFLTGTYESPALDGAIIQSFRAGILIGSRQEDNAFTWDSGSTLWTDATYTWDSGTAGSTTWDSASITWDSVDAKIRDWTGLYYPPTNTTQTLEWKFSDDDITYSAYSPAIPGDYSFRYLKFRITLTRDHVTNRQARVSILLTTASHATDAPADATYVVMSLNGTLTDERVLTAGEGIDITDGGAGGNVTEKVLFTSGELLRLRDSDNSNATTFGTGNQAVDIDYILPIAGASVNGQVLSSTTGNVLSWATPSATMIVQEDDSTVDAAVSTLDFTEPLATIVSSSPAGEANIDLSQYLLASGARALSGNLDAATNLILNIGAAGTDFVAGGGLNLAAQLKLAATVLLRFDDSDSSNFSAFQAGNQTTDVTYTLPTAAPSINGQVLSATTAGVMSWVTSSSALVVQEDDVDVDTAVTTIDFTEPLATIVTSSPAGEANVDLSQYLLASGARSLAGNLDFANFLALNIGAAGTDFTAGGGLTLASTLTLTGFTTGSVLFIGAAAAVSQDNANLFWDDSNNRLSIGSNENLITVAGGPEGMRTSIHLEDPGDEYILALHYHSAEPTLAGHLLFARSRGSEASETGVSSGDHLGEIQFVGHDGTDYAIGAIFRVTVDAAPGAGDMPSRFEFLTSADGSEAPTERMRIASTGLVTIGTGGTFTVATGAGDLAVTGDFEVEGQSRFDSVIGWGTAPVVSTILAATSSSATIVNGMDIDITATPGIGTLSAVVMNFSLTDEATHAGALTTVTGINVLTRFHRTVLPASTTQKAMNVQGYGVQSGTTIGSGTYDFYGLQITASPGGANISGGTFTFTDFRGSADPTGYAAGATMRHYCLKAQADCWIIDNEPFFWGTGEDCDIRYDGTSWLFNVNVATTNIVWNEAGLDTNFRIESDNKSAMFFLDAGLDRIGIGDISSPASILEIEEQTTLTGGLGDGFSAMILLDPAYTGAFTVTRHNYLKCENVAVSGSAVVTDACALWFDAAIGTHKAVNSGTTKVSIGVVTAWVLVNLNGVVHYMPCYASKTS